MHHTRPTTSDKLAIGDKVAHYGAIFEITGVRTYESYTGDKELGPVYVHDTRVVDGSKWVGPKHWLDDWKFQGNRLAHWAVIIEGSE